jgi:hypothetical protein
MSIWKTPRHYLKSEDEKHALMLLLKYNGSYGAYMQVLEESQKRSANMVKSGAHVQWGRMGNVVTNDVDLRARQLLHEIDRTLESANEWMDTNVLHGEPQRFPTKVLQMHLEDELDILLVDQIKVSTFMQT